MEKRTGKGERKKKGGKGKSRGQERKISEKSGWYKERVRFREGNRYRKARNVIK
jgi:hypothetical protein